MITIKKIVASIQNNSKLRSKNSKRVKNFSTLTYVFHIGKDNTSLIGFNPVIIDLNKLQIKRPSIDTKNFKKIQPSYHIYLYNIDESLLGTYELEKEDEDTFNLIKT